MDPTRRLPEELTRHVRDFVESGREPVEPRDASTVVLLREGDGQPGGLEVYLLRRVDQMAFAAGFCVFPGGGVDPRDFFTRKRKSSKFMSEELQEYFSRHKRLSFPEFRGGLVDDEAGRSARERSRGHRHESEFG